MSVPYSAVPRSLHPHLAEGALPHVHVLPERPTQIGVHPAVGADEGLVAVDDAPLQREYRTYQDGRTHPFRTGVAVLHNPVELALRAFPGEGSVREQHGRRC